MAEAVCTSHECEDDHSVETSELLSAESSLPRHELDACSLSKLSPKKSRVSDALEVVDKNLEVSNIEKVQCSLEKVNLQCESSLAESVKTKQETKVAKIEASKVEMSPGKRRLYSWLNKQMKIEMTDGRVLVGIFLCTDRDANVILGSCTEFLNPEVCGFTDEPRILGLVMVPGRHIVSIYHDAADPSATVDPSQTRQ